MRYMLLIYLDEQALTPRISTGRSASRHAFPWRGKEPPRYAL